MFYKNQTLFFVAFAAATLIAVNGCESRWSNWEITIPCSDYCGGGFNATYTRTCLNASACPCTGPTTKTKACNQNVCKLPRNSCFGSLKSLASNGDVICTTPEAVNITDPYPDTFPCCPPQGIWGSWIDTTTCNDTCGGYGIANRRRICLTEAAGCPCIDESTQTAAPCNTLACSDRSPCAPGLSLSVIGGIIMCTKNETTIKPSSCCPTFGVWEMWSSWSTCSSLCGGCAQATRSRTCASEKYGCPCSNSTATTETQACNRNACATGTKCCSPLIPFTLSSGEVLCFPSTVNITAPPPTTTTAATPTAPTTPGAGSWSEWSVASCTESCGLCGRVIKKRVCQNGSSCVGESQQNTTQICGGPNLCPLGLGLPSCCEPANRAIVGDEYRCVLPNNPSK
uniref:Uncharacterized protein n=1 Tax=Panagrolaimus sp. ES5 TaxID=591445 RepID=A0AC34G1L8_9BILA